MRAPKATRSWNFAGKREFYTRSSQKLKPFTTYGLYNIRQEGAQKALIVVCVSTSLTREDRKP